MHLAIMCTILWDTQMIKCMRIAIQILQPSKNIWDNKQQVYIITTRLLLQNNMVMNPSKTYQSLFLRQSINISHLISRLICKLLYQKIRLIFYSSVIVMKHIFMVQIKKQVLIYKLLIVPGKSFLHFINFTVLLLILAQV